MTLVDRIIDEIILGVLCALLMSLVSFSTGSVVALLCAVVMVCGAELLPRPSLRIFAVVAYMAAAAVSTSFALYLPLAAYLLYAERWAALRFAWIVPLAVTLRLEDVVLVASIAALCVAACLVSWRTQRAVAEGERYRLLRDSLQESSLALVRKNRDLLEKQDYEVRLATLAERGRIAREIHDNVGHLLTRSVLQVEALQVVHADDGVLKDELAAVGVTLHDAMHTVRTSVHDMHEDAFDLRTQLERIITTCGLEDVRLVYDVRELSTPVAYGMVAVVREALSNVAKHSTATRVEVSVREHPALYQLVVQDNGMCPPRCGHADGSGIGLRTMAERIEALGGRLRTEYDRGFRVFASIPKE